MAIATTIRTFAPAFNTGQYGWVNLTLASTAGISAATPLTITSGATAPGAWGGTLTLTPYHELPNNGYMCRITATTLRGNNYMVIRGGDAVSG